MVTIKPFYSANIHVPLHRSRSWGTGIQPPL